MSLLRPCLSRRAIVFLIAAAAWMGWAADGARAADAPDTPEAVVEAFHAALLDVMKNAKTLGPNGRYDKLSPAVERAFQLQIMTQIATGGAWRGATDKQKSALVDAFAAYTTANYASHFDGYNGESFKTVGRRDGPQETVLVDTKIVKASGSTVEITYVTKKIQGAWKVVDVVVDQGISELAVRRSEYARVLKDGGVERLVDVLREKAKELTRPKA